MTKTQRPDPAQIARLIETDELIRYVVEGLGGHITAIRDLQTPPVSSISCLERRADTLSELNSVLSPRH